MSCIKYGFIFANVTQLKYILCRREQVSQKELRLVSLFFFFQIIFTILFFFSAHENSHGRTAFCLRFVPEGFQPEEFASDPHEEVSLSEKSKYLIK